MKTKILLTLIMSLFCHLAQAGFSVVTVADVVNVEITDVPSKSCKAHDGKLYTVKLTTNDNTYAKSYCSGDYYIWGALYDDVYRLMEGAETPQCTLSESCEPRLRPHHYRHPRHHD